MVETLVPPRLRKLLHLRSVDVPLLRALGPVFVLVTAASVMTFSFAKAHFLSHNRFDALPWMFVGSGAFSLVASVAWLRFAGGRSPFARLTALTVLCVGMLVGFGLLAILGPEGSSLAVYVGTTGAVHVLVVQCWGFAAAALPVREARRLYPVLAASATAGAMLGGLLTAVVLALAGLVPLVLVAALLLVGVPFAAGRMGRSAPESAPPERPRPSAGLEVRRLFALPLFRTLFVLAVVVQVASVLLNLQLDAALKGTFDTRGIASFYAGYYAVSNAACILVALTAGAWIARRVGIGVAAGSATLAIAAGSLLSIGLDLFALPGAAMAIIGTSVGERVAAFGVARHAQKAALAPMDAGLAERARFVIDGVGARAATLCAGLGILIVGADIADFARVSPLVLVLAVLGGVVSLRVGPAYRRSLRGGAGGAAERASLRRWAIREVRTDTREQLRAGGADTVLGGLAHLRALGAGVSTADAARLLGHPDPRVVASALHLQAAVRQRVAAILIEPLLRPNADPDVLRGALRHLGEGAVELTGAVATLADHEDPLVRCLSLIWLRRHRAVYERYLAGGELGADERAPWTLVKSELGQPTPTAATRPPSVVRLLTYLRSLPDQVVSSDPSVRTRALDAIDALGLPELVRPLCASLADPEAAPTAMATLARLRPEVVLPVVEDQLEAAAGCSAGEGLRLLRVAELLRGQRVLSQAVCGGSPVLAAAAIGSLDRLGRTGIDCGHDADRLATAAAERIDELMVLARLDVVLRRTRDRRHGQLRADVVRRRCRAEALCWRLLSVLYPGRGLRAARTKYAAVDRRARSNAIELVDATLVAPRLRGFVAYLELMQPAAAGGPAALTLPPVDTAGGSGLAALLARTEDPVLPRIHRWATRPEEGDEIMSHVFLLRQSVPLFGEVLAEDLLPLADSAVVVGFGAGEMLFDRGYPGPRLVVVVRGQAEVLRDGAVVRTLSEGECFGELALTGQPPPPDVTLRAGSDLDCLVVERDDFEDALAASPGLARDVIRALSVRRHAGSARGDLT